MPSVNFVYFASDPMLGSRMETKNSSQSKLGQGQMFPLNADLNSETQ